MPLLLACPSHLKDLEIISEEFSKSDEYTVNNAKMPMHVTPNRHHIVYFLEDGEMHKNTDMVA
jgi:hypothetical protein